MKLVTFAKEGNARLGLVDGDTVIDLAAVSGGRLPSDLVSFLQQGDSAMRLASELGHTEATLPLSKVTLLAPLCPSKVVAIGQNYADHCREQHVEPPKVPIVFSKFPSAIVGPGAVIRWDPALTRQVDYEAELAVVIGRTARHVSAAEAMGYVAGYTLCNDISARDLQFGDGQWVRGKSLDTFCPLGPWLVTRHEIADPHALAIRATINGQVMQESSTSEMIFRVPELIEFCSRAFTLLPGDVIATGTPHGVGHFRRPPVYLKDGDVVTIEVQGIGQLTNRCVEDRRA